MSKRKVKWAMWSLGKIANRVIKEMRQADTYEIVAVCSSNYTKAQNFIESSMCAGHLKGIIESAC